MIGVIDVGGGMRDIYGSGVFDYCLENGISFDYCIGVSAGSANICSYMAGQYRRNVDFYTVYASRKEYMSVSNFLKTGNFLDLDYIYGTLSNSDGESPLDYEAMVRSGKIFNIVATDAATGKPKYFTMDDMSFDDFGPIKCSSCVPIVNKPYRFQGREYFDGGLSDPIPVKKAFDDGCDKVVLILTRPKDEIRNDKKDKRSALLLRRKYPESARALALRSRLYNKSKDLAFKYEKAGKLLIVAPDNIGKTGLLKIDKEASMRMYDKGHKDAVAIKKFLS